MIVTGAGIEAAAVTRRFGSVDALRGVDLTVPYGQVTALVGPNGAGKTTLMLVLATLLAPDGGRVRVAGHDVAADPGRVRGALGWMPDAFGMYDHLTAREYLAFFADAYLLDRATGQKRVTELLTLFRLEEHAGQPVHVLSRGQKQRLGLARALVHSPTVLLLDEPASGMDPRSRAELRDILRGLAADGVAVLVSSHILTELEEIADRVVLINHGRVVGEHTMAELAGLGPDVDARGTWRIRALRPDVLIEVLEGRDGLSARPMPAGAEVGPLSEDEAADLLAALVAAEARVVAFEPVGGGLEAAFLAMTREER
ncbi:ABC transporter ATP-binding protein [Thermomonospora umbrina]|uniref:ABC-2 type transport system ATP-binding protein n=1 Tax=Thermomonospora umbrina TaxID=111806 RepID=A0A3D9SUK3_9ACTN|nr:ABC transporter ATP-binding protein [Thermomonospora umbrina]REE98170.1 ABC-2 type transport system ATP-binding protein [Thermomonospora umbrina]